MSPASAATNVTRSSQPGDPRCPGRVLDHLCGQVEADDGDLGCGGGQFDRDGARAGADVEDAGASRKVRGDDVGEQPGVDAAERAAGQALDVRRDGQSRHRGRHRTPATFGHIAANHQRAATLTVTSGEVAIVRWVLASTVQNLGGEQPAQEGSRGRGVGGG
jgi:hypothetical protein